MTRKLIFLDAFAAESLFFSQLCVILENDQSTFLSVTNTSQNCSLGKKNLRKIHFKHILLVCLCKMYFITTYNRGCQGFQCIQREAGGEACFSLCYPTFFFWIADLLSVV